MSDALGDLETLRYEDRGGGVAVLRLHRPDRRNAWTLLMAHELDRACRAIDADGSIRVLVVTGSGDVFSVGADLTVGTILEPGDDEVGSLALHPMLPSAMDIPVIAAINGHAAGAGINFAMHCDLRILADSAKVAFPFVRRGVVPEMNMHWLLPRVVGSGVASDLLLTGRTVLADEALRLGVVHRILPADQILDDAIATAQDMVRTTAPLGSSFTKQLLREAMFSTAEEAWPREVAAFVRCAGHPDAVEGVISFLERRDPTWTATREPLSSIDHPYRRDADHRQIDQQ
jgi:enoyl-CoA hydratase/carnithine racemase